MPVSLLIQGDGFVLRKFLPSDAQALANLELDPEVKQFLALPEKPGNDRLEAVQELGIRGWVILKRKMDRWQDVPRLTEPSEKVMPNLVLISSRRSSMPLSPLEFLRHILDETEYLMDEKQDPSKEQFLQDATLKRAFVRSIEIIGEASKKVPLS